MALELYLTNRGNPLSRGQRRKVFRKMGEIKRSVTEIYATPQEGTTKVTFENIEDPERVCEMMGELGYDIQRRRNLGGAGGNM
jgi:hypothetical protein